MLFVEKRSRKEVVELTGARIYFDQRSVNVSTGPHTSDSIYFQRKGEECTPEQYYTALVDIIEENGDDWVVIRFDDVLDELGLDPDDYFDDTRNTEIFQMLNDLERQKGSDPQRSPTSGIVDTPPPTATESPAVGHIDTSKTRSTDATSDSSLGHAVTDPFGHSS